MIFMSTFIPAIPIAAQMAATYAPIGMIVHNIGESYRTPNVCWVVAKLISLMMPWYLYGFGKYWIMDWITPFSD